MLPKYHPMYKTYIDLRRCAARTDDFIGNFPEEKQNEVDLYISIHEKILELIEMIPREYR